MSELARTWSEQSLDLFVLSHSLELLEFALFLLEFAIEFVGEFLDVLTLMQRHRAPS